MFVNIFELAFEDFEYEGWSVWYVDGELKKIRMFFGIVWEWVDLQQIKFYLLEKIEVIVVYCFVVVICIKWILSVISWEFIFDLSEKQDCWLSYFINIFFGFIEFVCKYKFFGQYEIVLENLDVDVLWWECQEVGKMMVDIGLVLEYQLVLL